MPAGAPTKYNPEILPLVTRLCLLGLTDEELAHSLGVTTATIYNWKSIHPEFLESIADGRENADAKVARKLYKRALGVECTEEKIVVIDGVVEKHTVKKELPPDTRAAFIWLKNRRSGKWADRLNIDHSGSVTVEQALTQAINQEQSKD